MCARVLFRTLTRYCVIRAAHHLFSACRDTLATVYQNYHDEDSFLYITYSGESVFGGC